MLMKVVCFSLLSLATACAVAQDKIDFTSNKNIPLSAKVAHGKLRNGFTYYILNNSDSKKRIELRLLVKGGSDHEKPGQRQYAHLLEHLAFTGTKSNPQDAFSFFEGLGLTRGAHISGGTHSVHTRYRLSIPENDSGLFEKSIKMIRDWCDGFVFQDDIINKERQVVINELSRDTNYEGSQIFSSNFPWVLGGKTSYISHDSMLHDLKDFDKTALVEFFKNWYRPESQGLIIVGNVDTGRVKEMVNKVFGTLTGAESYEQFSAHAMKKDTTKMLMLSSNKFTSYELRLFARVPVNTLKNYKDLRDEMIGSLYTHMINERMKDILSEFEGKSRFHSSYDSRIPGSDHIHFTSLQVYLQVGSVHQLLPAYKKTITELERIRRFGFTATELIKAKSFICSLQDEYASKTLAESMDKHFVFGHYVPDTNMLAEMKRYCGELDVASVNGVIREWLSSLASKMILTAPDQNKDDLPGNSVFINFIQEVKKKKIAPLYPTPEKPRNLLVPENFPETGSREINQVTDSMGVVRLSFKSGLQVVLKKTKSSGYINRVYLHAFSPGGASVYKSTDKDVAKLSADIVSKSGFDFMNGAELKDFFKERSIKLSPYIEDHHEGLSGSFPLSEMENVLKAIYLYFTLPRVEPDVLTEYRRNGRETALSPKRWTIEDSIVQILYPKRITQELFSTSSLGDVGSDRVQALFKDRFSGADDFTFIFAGDFDVNDIKPLLVKYLGSLPVMGRHEKPVERPSGKVLAEGPLRQTIQTGLNKHSVDVNLFLSGKFHYTLRESLVLNVLTKSMELVLDSLLRGKHGGTYVVSSGLMLFNPADEKYLISFYYSTQDGMSDSMISVTKDAIANINRSGVPVDVFKKAVSLKTQFRQLVPVGTVSLLNGLIESFKYGNPVPLQLLENPGLYNKVTHEELNNAALKYLDAGRLIEIIGINNFQGN